MKIGILGGGLSGLSLACFLKCRTEVLEKDAICGGLCRSFNKNGFTYDYGGHIIFSRDKEALEFMVKMLGDNSNRLYRNNRIWYKGRFVKYPFENGLSALPKEDIYECMYYYLKNDSPEPGNFKEWIYYNFGKGIAEKFLIPYNQKIWNVDLETMGIEWVERIPKPPLQDIIKSAVGIETEGYTHQLYFYYPEHGGIQSFITAIESKVPDITRGFEVKKVKKARDGWVVSDGRREKEFDKVISAMPIFDLAKAMDKVPERVMDAVNKLRFNSLIVIMVGVNGENLSDKLAVYLPQRDLKFHRFSFNRYFGANYCPKGKSGIIAEITANEGDPTWEMNDDDIIEEVVNGLDREGFINRNEVCETDLKRREYAYVVYDLDYGRRMEMIRDYFKHAGIELCGRFAEFKYLNMDACIRRAMDVASRINKGGIDPGEGK